MRRLGSILSGSAFEKPDWTREQWEENDRKVRESQREQREAMISRRIRESGIPKAFMGAELGSVPEVAEFASRPSIGLLIQGKTGRGKTYQACAALRLMAQDGTVRFTTFDDLLRECKATFESVETEKQVIERYANTGALCIDDMGKERLTEWSLPIVFAVINKRYNMELPTIITTQYSGKVLLERMTVNGDSETARAIISRMTCYDRVVMSGKDWRLS